MASRQTLADLAAALDKPKQRARKRVAGGVAGAVADSKPVRRAEAKATSALRKSVEREAAKARRGDGPKTTTGNVLAGAGKPSRAERERSERARIRAARGPEPVDRSLRQDIGRELKGEGYTAKFVKQAADAVGREASKAVIPNTGAGPTAPGRLASKGLGAKHSGRLAAVTAPGTTALKNAPAVRRAVEDAINFPAQAVPSLYVPAAAAVELAQGKPARAKKLVKDIKEQDPLYALATGDVKRAGKLAAEHPGFAALEAYGAKGAVGRGAGRVLRAAPKGSKLHKAGSTARAARIGPEGTRLKQTRQYSRDSTQKAAQVLAEKARARAHRAAVARAADTGKGAGSARALDPKRMSEREVRKRLDERVDVNEAVARSNASQVTADVHHAVTTTKPLAGGAKGRAKTVAANRSSRTKPDAATTLRAQAIISDDPADLVKLRGELAAKQTKLPPAKRAANKELLKQIDAAIQRPGAPAARREAAESYAKTMAPITEGLAQRGLLDPKQAELAPLVPYATRNMGATYRHGPAAKAGLVDESGAPLTAQRIRNHMARAGVAEPGHVTQAPPRIGTVPGGGKAGTAGAHTRTGVATSEGTFNADPKALAETAVRGQRYIDAADGYSAMVNEFAHKPSAGKLKTKDVADQAARDLAAETGEGWRAVRTEPFRDSGVDALGDTAIHGDDIRVSPKMEEALTAALRGEGKSGPYALIPESVADQMQKQIRAGGHGGPKAEALRKVSSSFRRTVLATSPSWIAGNVIETAGRSAITRAGPLSYVTGRRVLTSLDAKDPVAAAELRMRAVGGGHYGTAGKLPIHTDPEKFAGSAIKPFAETLQKMWEKPGPKQAAAVWHAWSDIMFRQLNGRFEEMAQTAMMGRALRESPLMPESGLKLSRTAIDQAADGLTGTNEQAAFARYVRRGYGRYGAYSPDMKMSVAMYTPFIAWTLNAVRFAYDVLPRDHPALTSLIASSEQVTEEWRKEHGLDLFIKDRKPGFLQGSIPLSGGRSQRAPTRYTPFGAFSGGILETVENGVLPQFSGVLSAARGQDWTGKKLRGPDGGDADEMQKAAVAVVSFLDATIPLLAVGKRVAKKGVKKGLNPFQPVEPGKEPASSAGSTGSPPDDLDAVLDGSVVQSDLDAVLGG